MQKDLSSVSGVVKLENPKIHNQYTAVCSGNTVCITQGGNGETPWEVRAFCDLCRALQRGLCWKKIAHGDEKEYSSPVSVERDVRESYVQVSGAVTHSQLQRQKKTIWAVYLGKMCFVCNR